jgi:DNA primase
MPSATDRLLDSLDGVRPSGHRAWKAICPAHADRDASLSIREVDGKILIHCFSGCATAYVLKRLGLQWKDLFLRGSR